jgi:cell division protein FtsB
MSTQITLKFDDDDHLKLTKQAADSGMKLATFVKLQIARAGLLDALEAENSALEERVAQLESHLRQMNRDTMITGAFIQKMAERAGINVQEIEAAAEQRWKDL